MSVLEFDFAAFKTQFPDPQFVDPPFTEAVLQLYWDAAICYITDNTPCNVSDTCQLQLLNLMLAHLATVATATADGEQSGFVSSASIDKISVTIESFQSKNQFQTFLNQTPYGQQVYALLYVRSVGGRYVGGCNELGSFRRAGGRFFPAS